MADVTSLGIKYNSLDSVSNGTFRIHDNANGAQVKLQSSGSGESFIYLSTNSEISRKGGDLNILANGIDMNLSVDNGTTKNIRINSTGVITFDYPSGFADGAVGFNATDAYQRLRLHGFDLLGYENGSL